VNPPDWLSRVRGDLHRDAALRQSLLQIHDAQEFCAQVAALAGPPVTPEDVQAAFRTARREWLERWLS
jgi:hypothetical protein